MSIAFVERNNVTQVTKNVLKLIFVVDQLIDSTTPRNLECLLNSPIIECNYKTLNIQYIVKHKHLTINIHYVAG